MKKFKTESKRMLDLMINSIYTHKEVFIRELLSNASDAIDRLYYKSLTGGISGLNRDDFAIYIATNKENRTITISDNGIGMTKEELEDNLGVIAKSGSFDFKKELEKTDDINIIGQFGVGFYSAFMVSKKVEVLTRAYGQEKGYLWVSSGPEGYEIKETDKPSYGTDITLHLKENTQDEIYDDFLEEYSIKGFVKKFSDYIRYPIKMEVVKYKENEKTNLQEKYTEEEILNSMVPLWKKDKKDITKEEYDKFYKESFYDGDAPLGVIHTSAEGLVSYQALLYIPSKAPYEYYTKKYEKGLRLYTNGVLIMEKCKELVPDYYSFVKGVVDSELTLNISRETIQHNRQLKVIAKNIEKKIKAELLRMLEEDRETYIKFFKAFGLQLKFGLYDQWGLYKDAVKDLVMFHSLKEDKLITLQEYVKTMGVDQKYIYYATGKTVEAIKTLPQCEKITELGYDILCFTEDIDEFAIKSLLEFEEKEFRSIQSSDLGIESKQEDTDEDKEIMEFIKNVLEGKVAKVKLSRSLKTHPVCISTEGEVTLEMEKVLKSMPNAPKDVAVATKILEINANHKIYETIKESYKTDQDRLKKIAIVLYSQALLIEGVQLNNPTEIANMICDII
ncbi:MAG: molecular chaperone HtpG [Clostridiales bacterium]|nr:molecular chaperone HtpG [Clostridiales bacterium]